MGAARVDLRACGAVLVAVAAVHAFSLGGDLVLDAHALVLEDPVIRRATLANVGFILTHDYWQPMATGGLYRPLTTLSFLVNWALFGNGARPLGYHLANVTLHLGVAALVFALVRSLAGSTRGAALAAALFALHPVTTEVVANVAGRADLLAALGVLAALACHRRATAGGPAPRAAWRIGLLVAAVVGCFAKENALALVAILVAHDVVFAVPLRRSTPAHAIVLAVATAYLGARAWVAHAGFPPEDVSPVDNPIAEAGFVAGRLTALGVLPREALLALFPWHPSADYSFRQIPVAGATVPAAALVLTGLALGGVWLASAIRWRRRDPALAFVLAAAFLAWLPTANLLVVIGSIRADRFLYLPLAFLAAAAALGIDRLLARPPVAVAAAAVLLCFGARTAARSLDWRDELRLWTATVATAPASAKAHKAYAAALAAADPSPTTLTRAIGEAETAVGIRPDYEDALVDLGGYWVLAGDAARAHDAGDEATRAYARAVEALERARTVDEANARRAAAKLVARGMPRTAVPRMGNPLLYNDLSLAYGGLGRLNDALAAYETLRLLEPTRPEHYRDVSAILARLGQWEDAAVALFQAATLDGGDRETVGRLVEIYRRYDAGGHALRTDVPGRIDIDDGDPLVRRHRCAAYAGLVSIYSEAQLLDLAGRVRTMGAERCRPVAGGG